MNQIDLFDLINGSFEILGAFILWLNVVKLHHDKVVRGFDWRTTAFFTSWGVWNLFYYPSLDQWLSFFGGLAIVTVNTIWLGLLFYYIRKRKKHVDGTCRGWD